MKVVITDEAEADLERFGDHIAIDNPGRAATFTNELIDACLGLAEMPLRFSKVPRYEKRCIRRRPYGAYLIFYRVHAEQVEILHVLHGAQDYQAILFPEQ